MSNINCCVIACSLTLSHQIKPFNIKTLHFFYKDIYELTSKNDFVCDQNKSCKNLKTMEHLLGSFVPPPLLLVLVSTLPLLLLTQKETVKGYLQLLISETGCKKKDINQIKQCV